MHFDGAGEKHNPFYPKQNQSILPYNVFCWDDIKHNLFYLRTESIPKTYVTVFRPYRQEAVPLTTTHLPISLALSLVVVDIQTWPSVPLGPCPGCHQFSCQNACTHCQMSLVVVSHPPSANSCLNFRIKADPNLDPCLFWVDIDLEGTS